MRWDSGEIGWLLSLPLLALPVAGTLEAAQAPQRSGLVLLLWLYVLGLPEGPRRVPLASIPTWKERIARRTANLGAALPPLAAALILDQGHGVPNDRLIVFFSLGLPLLIVTALAATAAPLRSLAGPRRVGLAGLHAILFGVLFAVLPAWSAFSAWIAPGLPASPDAVGEPIVLSAALAASPPIWLWTVAHGEGGTQGVFAAFFGAGLVLVVALAARARDRARDVGGAW